MRSFIHLHYANDNTRLHYDTKKINKNQGKILSRVALYVTKRGVHGEGQTISRDKRCIKLGGMAAK